MTCLSEWNLVCVPNLSHLHVLHHFRIRLPFFQPRRMVKSRAGHPVDLQRRTISSRASRGSARRRASWTSSRKAGSLPRWPSRCGSTAQPLVHDRPLTISRERPWKPWKALSGAVMGASVGGFVSIASVSITSIMFLHGHGTWRPRLTATVHHPARSIVLDCWAYRYNHASPGARTYKTHPN